MIRSIKKKEGAMRRRAIGFAGLGDPRNRVLGAFAICAILCVEVYTPSVRAQSTQGLILGSVVDGVTGKSISGATVAARDEATGHSISVRPDADGNYVFASLSPGEYRLSVDATGYQSQQVRKLNLPIAGRLELNLRLRPLTDVWEAGQFRSWLAPQSQQSLGFYGPDVDTSRIVVLQANRGTTTPLEIARSDVVEDIDIEALPLAGRDAYALLLLQPGVTSDVATGRGLGFSVNGQRPSSSNYLLDGLDNNNLLVTGPLSAARPEMVEEYRVATSNYSAEYGRTSGFIANAVTPAGTARWHADGFTIFGNDHLDANGFQENASGIPRPPLHFWQPAGSVSGPILSKTLFVSGAFEAERSETHSDPISYILPTQNFIDAQPASFGSQILRQYPPAEIPRGPGDFAAVAIQPPAPFDRDDGLLRLDGTPTSNQHLFARGAIDRIDQPDLLFDPYPKFSTDFRESELSVAAGWISQIAAPVLSEFRIGRTGDSTRFEPQSGALPEMLDLQRTSMSGLNVISLPGENSFYNYRNGGAGWELSENLVWTRRRHTAKFGAGFLARNSDLRVQVLPQGRLEFASLSAFQQGTPEFLLTEADRFSNVYAPVTPDRSYRYLQFDMFAEDSFHVSNRFTFEYGIRFDSFGIPRNVGAQKDALIPLKQGSGIESAIALTSIMPPPAVGSQAIYTARRANWAPRIGVAWDPRGNARTVLRGGYGIFYDRLFDNLWENVIENRYSTAIWRVYSPVSASLPLSVLEASGTLLSSTQLIPGLAFQPFLRAPYAQNAYLGVQQKIADGLVFEVNAIASRGRELITTDEVNRAFSLPSSGTSLGYFNDNVGGYLNYRANQGSSDYAGMAATLRIRRSRWSGQVSYTWSHSIDNQSEPLAGTFLDFNQFTGSRTTQSYISSFTEQFRSGADRANSDFDQRQNLVFYQTYKTGGILTGPVRRITQNWTAAFVGAIRSGVPYSVYANSNGTTVPTVSIVNQRADLIDSRGVYVDLPATGGQQLLNSAAFAQPATNSTGNTGRNEFTGPGLLNLDLSIAREFWVRIFNESTRIEWRADFYNVLNHANLNNPNSYFMPGNPDFGIALYGRQESNNGFPAFEPLTETARQIQLTFRLAF